MRLFSLIFLLISLSAFIKAEDPPVVMVFGDSIAAGYGLDLDDAFPAQMQRIADEEGVEVEIINSGLSGETSSGGLRRVDWVLQQHVDIFVLELGGNDGLRGIDPEVTKNSLQQIMDKVRETYPNVQIILAGMEAPPNMGDSYTSQFRTVFSDLAKSNDVIFMPFILEDVAGEPDLNLPDGIHPTEEGHEIIAKNLWPYVLEALERVAVTAR